MDQYCFDKARQLDADWLVPVEIAAIYLHYRNFSRALLRVRRACAAAPEQSFAWLMQARCQQALGLDGPDAAQLADVFGTVSGTRGSSPDAGGVGAGVVVFRGTLGARLVSLVTK